MRAYFKGIAIFKSSTDKRTLPLSEGLNIITGNSQTGKSAIYDIIDWCLGSDNCSIPKGRITQFAQIYAIIFSIKGISYLIARKGENESKFMFIDLINSEIEIDDIKYEDINFDKAKTKKEVIQVIDKALNLDIEPTGDIPINFYTDTSKAGIRSAISYIFQHQGIIANKNLFYYLPIKSHFPVLAGWIEQEYYANENALKNISTKYNQKEREFKQINKDNSELESNLRQIFRMYYNSNNALNEKYTFEEFENLEIEKLEEITKTFAEKPKFVNTDKLGNRQQQIINEQRKLRSERTVITNTINKLKSIQSEGNNLRNWLSSIQPMPIKKNHSNICPVCNNPSFPLSEIATKINNAEIWLNNELISIGNTEKEYDKEIELYDVQKKLIDDKIKSFQNELDEIDIVFQNVIKQKPEEDQIYHFQRDIINELSFFKRKYKYFDKKELMQLENDKNKLEMKLQTQKIGLKQKSEIGIIEIQNLMNEIATALNFEHKPANLFFDLEKFELFHINETDEEKYSLTQVGSASNYLACHISLFLSLLYYFSTQPSSKVPSVLFLDQPSQTYFSNGKELEKDTDILRVKAIYDTLLKIIDKIKAKAKYLPQIIVSDHIEHLGNNSEYLTSYFKRNWRNGEGLI